MALYNPSLRSKKELITTSDGTKTMYSSEFDECYHSTKDGALKESLNKHVIPASKLISKESITILDICYGLGFNTLSSIYYYQKNYPNRKLHIISPELDRELVESLKNFEYPEEFSNLKEIIKALSKDFFYQDKNLKIEILIGDAREHIKNIESKIDIIYQDAFSPKKNPALWSVEYFADIKNIIAKDGIITTYSVATPVRLSMYQNRFFIYSLKSNSVRSGTIASLQKLNLEAVDMQLKLQRNPNAKAIYDKDIEV
jgi:tRNA U34 5-methylaminomethyl-2-thiouridine-forming methyltransferase MnmC